MVCRAQRGVAAGAGSHIPRLLPNVGYLRLFRRSRRAERAKPDQYIFGRHDCWYGYRRDYGRARHERCNLGPQLLSVDHNRDGAVEHPASGVYRRGN
jgi:hypothetical protein